MTITEKLDAVLFVAVLAAPLLLLWRARQLEDIRRKWLGLPPRRIKPTDRPYLAIPGRISVGAHRVIHAVLSGVLCFGFIAVMVIGFDRIQTSRFGQYLSVNAAWFLGGTVLMMFLSQIVFGALFKIYPPRCPFCGAAMERRARRLGPSQSDVLLAYYQCTSCNKQVKASLWDKKFSLRPRLQRNGSEGQRNAKFQPRANGTAVEKTPPPVVRKHQ